MASRPPFKPQWIVTAPGRVNLLGEHVDYNDGAVLPAAIDRAVTLRAAPRPGTCVLLRALDLQQSVEFDLNRLPALQDDSGRPLPAWALYPAGVALALQQRGLLTPAFEAEFTSDVPIGAGLSSSAAVEVAFAVLWQQLGGWLMDRLTLAQVCRQAEQDTVGVHCGLMDQFASANGVNGCALYFNTRTLAWQPVALPPGLVLVIADSGVRRSLAQSAYNERRAACEQALRLLSPHLPGIRALRDVTPAEFERFAGRLPETTARRARHVVDECARVPRAVQMLQQGDAVGFGREMLDCHASLRDLYEVSCPELDALVEIAAGLPGCLGARLTGAGFGGCTVNLVQEAHAPAFIPVLRQEYAQRTGRQAAVYLCRAVQGAHIQAALL